MGDEAPRGIDLLRQEMGEDVLEGLLGRMEARVLEPGDVLIRQGRDCGTLYLVRSGRLVMALEAAGERLDVGAVGPGEWVGEVGLLDPGPATATVRAEEQTRLLALSEETLRAIRDDDPALAAPLLRALCRALARRVRVSSRGVLRGDATGWRLAPADRQPGGWLARLFQSMSGGT